MLLKSLYIKNLLMFFKGTGSKVFSYYSFKCVLREK